MVCPSVRGDNPRALASGISTVHTENHALTNLSHSHVCTLSTSANKSWTKERNVGKMEYSQLRHKTTYREQYNYRASWFKHIYLQYLQTSMYMKAIWIGLKAITY